MEQLVNLIGNYVFPVAMCLLMFWKLDKDETTHREEMDKLSESLNNNTLVIQKLIDKMEGGD